VRGEVEKKTSKSSMTLLCFNTILTGKVKLKGGNHKRKKKERENKEGEK